MKKFTALLAVSLVLGANGMALAADNAAATATAYVIVPIAVSKTTDMVFGNIVPGNGVVTLSTSGARSKTGATALSTTGSTPTAAVFSVTGEAANTFSILYTGSSTTLAKGADSMAIDWITESVTGAGAATGKVNPATDAATGTLTAGAALIYAGAALTVDNAQAAGSYTGTLNIIVAYN